MSVVKGLGWIKEKPDHRDLYYKPNYVLSALSTKVDLRDKMPDIFDQSKLGSCTAQAVGGLSCYLQIVAGFNYIMPSRLFIYYNTRLLENNVDVDSGGTIRTAMSVLARYGCPNESLWWYNITKFTVRPSQLVYKDGLHRKILQYAKVPQTLSGMKAALIARHPIVLGFTVYPSFMNVGSDGMVPMPENAEPVGGHAVLIVGFDDAKGRFIVRNSWGTDWGDNGYCYFPYEYFTNTILASDLWTATTMLIS
jgi:C1A family cysteine protease